MDIRFLGHASFALAHEGTTVLIDPWLDGNPQATVAASEVEADAILLTHGHHDHMGDVAAIAKRTGATVVCTAELWAELEADGVEHLVDLNYGGTATFDWGWARMVPAWHATTTEKGTAAPPAGFVVELGGVVVYHLGDTCLFSDLALPGRRTPIDVALVPIGGHFTMDRHDAVEAAKLVAAGTVVPCHFGTFDLIETDVEAFRADAQDAGVDVTVLAPGEALTR